MAPLKLIEDWAIENVVERLSSDSTVVLRILDEDLRLRLLREAESYVYLEQPEFVGKFNVRQQLASFSSFGQRSPFVLLKNEFQSLLERKLANIKEYPFQYPLQLNEAVIQRYERGSLGLSPHRDNLNCINVVCVFVIDGTADFYVCEDRSGKGARKIDSAPGNLIIMRAPGFLGSDFRPFHLLTNITERRYSFALRQIRRLF